MRYNAWIFEIDSRNKTVCLQIKPDDIDTWLKMWQYIDYIDIEIDETNNMENKASLSHFIDEADSFAERDDVISARKVKESLTDFLTFIYGFGELGHISTLAKNKAKQIFGDELLE